MSRWVVACCLLLAGLVYWRDANQALFLMLHHAAALLPAVVWRLLSMFGEWPLVIGALLLLAQRQPERLPQLIMAVLVAIAAAILLKAGFAQPRPSLVLPPGSVRLLDVLPGNAAFPSGHAIAAALLAGVLAQGRGVWQQGGLFLAVLLVCWSRIAIGVHWPLDVLVGAALGWAVAALFWRVVAEGWPQRLTRRVLQLLAWVLLVFCVVQVWRVQPNEAYLLFNALAGVAALVVLRQKENGA